MQSVTVLLSTYNGEKFISEQLDSLLTQEGVNVRIRIRDDGSTDGTLQILEKYHSLHPDRIFVEYGDHRGFSGSFFSLAEKAEDSEFYAFCDQDDVWMKDKLAAALSLINGASALPEMYFSNALLTDSRLHPAGPLYGSYRFPPLLSMRLTDNPAPGCTIVFNKKARDLFVRADADRIVYHDFWMYLLCSYLGKVFYDKNCKVLYRQHEGNVMGPSRHKKTWPNRIRKLFRKLHLREYAASELSRLYKKEIAPSELQKVELMACYRNNLSSAVRLLFHKEICGPTPRKNFWFRLQVILGSA